MMDRFSDRSNRMLGLSKRVKGIEILLLLSVFSQTACSQTAGNHIRDLGNGLLDHGVAVPIATSRGTVATVDEQGHNVILTWLSDHRGTYSLLRIDTDEEKSKQFFLPFNGPSYTSILSSQNRYYTHFNSRFVEFDPARSAFTFIGKTSPGSATSMVEDDEGVIWAVLMPSCSLVSYNPMSEELNNYGVIHSQKARQIPRSIAVDDSGWIYVTGGPPGKERVVAFNPKSQKSRIVQKKEAASLKNISLFKGRNGKVFSKLNKDVGMEFYKGKGSDIKIKKMAEPRSYITGNQALFHRSFPDDKRISDWISAVNAGFLSSRMVKIHDPKTDQSRNIAFDYETEGASLMGVATGPDGKIVGGSNFPMHFFQYDPNEGTWNRHNAYGQFNTWAIQGNQLFIGGYTRGFLLKWDPAQEWIPTRKKEKGTNPQFLAEAHPDIFRPHDLLSYPDDRTIIMAGRPRGGRSGGGLLFWDRQTHTAEVLKHTDVLPNQSTQSLVALPDDKILGGTTITPGDLGGVPKAKEAELYIMDLKSRKIEWSKAVIPNVKNYQDLCVAPNGLIVGVAERDQFFVFDPETRKILKQLNLEKAFGSKIPYTQGQRSFIKGPKDEIYLLLEKGILQINSDNFEMNLLAESPAKINGGGAYLNGRIYYVSGGRSRIHSYTLPTKNRP